MSAVWLNFSELCLLKARLLPLWLLLSQDSEQTGVPPLVGAGAGVNVESIPTFRFPRQTCPVYTFFCISVLAHLPARTPKSLHINFPSLGILQ